MKRSIYAIALLGAFAVSTAFAGGNSNNSDTINNFGDTNTYNSPEAYATGIGFGGAGGNSDVDVRNTNTNTALGGNAAVIGSGNSNTEVDVRNTNTNLNNVHNNVENDVRNTNTNVLSNGQSQGQGQEQSQGQGQSQGQSQNAYNAGNKQSTSISIAAPKTYRPPVSSAFAPTVFPTAPCMGSSSIGGTGTLFSISGGTSWESKECMILETARNFEQAGAANDAMYIRCQGKYAAAAPTCKALREGKEALATPNSKATASTEEEAGFKPTSNAFPYPQLDATQLY